MNLLLKPYVLPFRLIILLASLQCALSVFAASNTLIPTDSNTGLNVENAVINDDSTTMLFWTFPEIGNPGAGEECPLNFYTVELRPGLSTAEAQLVAKNVCGNGLSKARLLDNGETLMLTSGRLERWRDGKNISSTPLTDQEITKMLGVDTSSGGQTSVISVEGDVVTAAYVSAALYAGNNDLVLMLTNMDKDGEIRWQTSIAEPGQRLTLENMWAGKGGSVLLQTGLLPADNSSLTMQRRLYLIDAEGKQQKHVQISTSDEPDLQTLMQNPQADLQQALASLQESNPESIRKMDAAARQEGGYDVLFQRESKADGRGGHYLLRIGADGVPQNEQDITEPIIAHGLEEWVDFYVDGHKLMLLSRVLVSQPGIQARRKSHSQNVISVINLDTNALVTHLVPLDHRYLQAAMDAGDEELQYLENRPGGKPVLLSRVGGVPLAISKGYLSHRPALRLDEGTVDLPAYTEVYTQRSNEIARQQNQQAKQQSSNYETAVEAGMKQAPTASASMPTSVDIQDINAQIAAAMAQAEQGLSPEMAEQVNAALAQVQQQMGAAGMTLPSDPSSATTTGTAKNAESAFNMTVMDVFKISGRGVVLTGRVDAGSVSVGDSVCLQSAKSGARVLQVESIEQMSSLVDSASAGDMLGILVNGIEAKDVSKNDQLRSSCK